MVWGGMENVEKNQGQNGKRKKEWPLKFSLVLVILNRVGGSH